MSRWVAIFEDDPAGAWIRQQHQGDHFAYLDQHRDEILLAGGLRPNPGEWYCGGLWVMEVADREDAVRLCEDDPYFRLGLRKGYRLCMGEGPAISRRHIVMRTSSRPNRHRQAARVALGRIGKRPRQPAMYAACDRGTGERVEEVVAGGAFGRRAVHHRCRKTGFDQQPATQRETRFSLFR